MLKHYERVLPLYLITILDSVIEKLAPNEKRDIKNQLNRLLKETDRYMRGFYKQIGIVDLNPKEIKDNLSLEDKRYSIRHTFSKATECSAIMLNRTIRAINEGEIEDFFKYVEQYDTHKLVKKNLNG